MKALFFQVGFASVLCISAVVGYYFWYSMIEGKSAEVALLESQILSHTQNEMRAASTRASLMQIPNYETSIQNYFVMDTNVVDFIEVLQAVGTEQGTTIDVLSVAKAGTSVQPTLTLALSITGTFDAVMRTTGAIEFSPYAITFSDFSLQHDSKTSWHAQLNLVVGSLPPSSVVTTPGEKKSATP